MYFATKEVYIILLQIDFGAVGGGKGQNHKKIETLFVLILITTTQSERTIFRNIIHPLNRKHVKRNTHD
jgi:hypothetical protein